MFTSRHRRHKTGIVYCDVRVDKCFVADSGSKYFAESETASQTLYAQTTFSGSGSKVCIIDFRKIDRSARKSRIVVTREARIEQMSTYVSGVVEIEPAQFYCFIPVTEQSVEYRYTTGSILLITVFCKHTNTTQFISD